MAGTEYRSDEVKVGILVLASLAILAIFFGAVLGLRPGARADYHAGFRSVAGLEKGSPVTFGGYQVGRVSAIRVSGVDAGVLDVELSLDGEIRLPMGTRATIDAPIFGETKLELVAGDPADGYMEPGAEIEGEEPLNLTAALKSAEGLIGEAGETIHELRGTLDELTDTVGDILANVEELLGAENRDHVASILEEAEGTIADARPKVASVLDKVEAASAELQQTSISARSLAQNLDGLVEENREELDALIVSAQAAAEEMRSAVADLNRILGAQQGNMEETIANLHETSENLVELTRMLKEKPWSLVRKTKPREETWTLAPGQGEEVVP